ncbi:hypothetical protein [Bradyrhizobium sp. Ai1a-2]|uniref:hypothetical protein n=1 Tax=Bradyrhizobium sp. Ai1a-2 TaxID=196490 RepID=UPI0004845860|nr:hypothetical protein [Bradyrhizobium sp. Ai1a-2]
MAENKNNELEEWLVGVFDEFFDLLVLHHRTLLKAPIMSYMTAITVVIFTGSYWKATWISFAVFLLSLFTTWRRYLEPLCFFAFAAAVIAECSSLGTLAKLQLVFTPQ